MDASDSSPVTVTQTGQPGRLEAGSGGGVSRAAWVMAQGESCCALGLKQSPLPAICADQPPFPAPPSDHSLSLPPPSHAFIPILEFLPEIPPTLRKSSRSWRSPSPAADNTSTLRLLHITVVTPRHFLKGHFTFSFLYQLTDWSLALLFYI